MDNFYNDFGGQNFSWWAKSFFDKGERMTSKWIKSKYPGVRYREHETRKHGIKKDQYFIISYRVDGKRKDEAIGWASKGASAQIAMDRLSEIMRNQREGTGPQTLNEKRTIEKEKRKTEQEKIQKQIKTNVAFNVFFNERYLPASIHKKAYTIQNEKSLFKNWIGPEIGHLPFSKITSFNLEKIRKKMADAGRADRSIQYCLALIRQVWNMARANGHIESSTPKIKLKKFDNKRLRFFSHEEARILLKHLKEISQQTHDMTLLSLHTGARAGEIFSITWGSVNFENEVITAKDTKSGKNRFLYMTNEVKAMLERRFTGHAINDFVFHDRNGEKIKLVSKTFDRTIEKLGFNEGITDRRDKATFHTLRHTFASWHVQNGTDLYTVKELLGHSTIALTERYSHLRPEGLKQTTALFNNAETMDINKRKIVLNVS